MPNEQVQQAAGQAQDGNVFENIGTISYQHVFSSDIVGDLRGMIRDNSTGLSSNILSTPIIVFQQNHFTEGYFNGIRFRLIMATSSGRPVSSRTIRF